MLIAAVISWGWRLWTRQDRNLRALREGGACILRVREPKSGRDSLMVNLPKGRADLMALVAGLRRVSHVVAPDIGADNSNVEQLDGLTSIHMLVLSGNPVDDRAMPCIGRLWELKELRLARTDVTNEGLSALSELQELEYLDLSDTAVTDAGLEYLKPIWSLRSVKLRGTRVTKDGVENLVAARGGLAVHWDGGTAYRSRP